MVTLNPSATTGLNNTNFLQPTNFKITLDRKHFTNLEFFCQSVSHPDMMSNAADVSYQRITQIPMPGDKLSFGEFTCMILLDENMNSYKEMYDWMSRIVETKQVNALDRSPDIPPTHADVTLSILSSHNNQNRKIRYIDCIPTGLGAIQFESMASGDQFLTFAASFRFSYFEFS
jgi:hypothetical protein